MFHWTPDVTNKSCACSGSMLLLLGTFLHPMRADPNEPRAAFVEYAANEYWVASHLLQMLGLTFILIALLRALQLAQLGKSNGWLQVARIGVTTSLTTAVVLQAVDGIALKAMTDLLATALPPEKNTLFYATLAVRQIEIGLASLLSLSLGSTVIVSVMALHAVHRQSGWLPILGSVGGLLTVVSGLAMAYTGFSSTAMAIAMPGEILLIMWLVAMTWQVRCVDCQ